MFFNSIKQINRLRKEINRSLTKGVSNIYLKVTIEKNWRSQNFDFLILKICQPVSFHLTMILLNFKTKCCKLKVRGLGAKVCVSSLLFLFWKELWSFETK